VGAAAAGCTLAVGAAGRSLVEAGGVLRLCPRGSCYVLAAQDLPLQHNNQTAKLQPQKLLWQRCCLSAAAVAAGGSSIGSSIGSSGDIGCDSDGGNVSISGKGGGGGGGPQWQQWQRRQK
jgi:hypothetical protein